MKYNLIQPNVINVEKINSKNYSNFNGYNDIIITASIVRMRSCFSDGTHFKVV